LMRNAGLKFVCKSVGLRVETTESAFTSGYAKDQVISIPIAHHDGNYNLSPDDLAALQDQHRIAFRYDANPNGSVYNIAGVLSENRRVLGMMPHPERAVDPAHPSTDGQPFFASLLEQMATT